jgi:ABC-type transporter Mla subunit MlaD
MKVYLIILSLFLLTSCSEKKIEITINAEKIEGLNKDARITINGFEIGNVTDFKIAKDGSINIECNLNSEMEIPIDSKFKIEGIDFLGSKEIMVELGTNSEKIKNGEKIKLAKTELNNLNNSLNSKIGELFENLIGTKKQDSILIELRRLNENLEKVK